MIEIIRPSKRPKSVIKVQETAEGQRLHAASLSKSSFINFGELAYKNEITPNDVSAEKTFIIECVVDEKDLLLNDQEVARWID